MQSLLVQAKNEDPKHKQQSSLIIDKQSKLEELTKEVGMLEKAKRIICQLYMVQQKTIQELEEQSEKYQKEILTNTQLQQELYQEVNQLETQKKIDEQNHQQQQQQMNSQIRSLGEEKNEAQIQLSNAMEKNNELLQNNEQTRNQNDKLLEKIWELEENLNFYQLQISELNIQVKNLKNEKEEQQKLTSNQLSIGEQTIKKLQDELQQTFQIKYRQEKEIKELLNEKGLKNKAIETLTQVEQKLTKQLDQQIKRHEETKLTCQRLESEFIVRSAQLQKEFEEKNNCNIKLIEELTILNKKQEESQLIMQSQNTDQQVKLDQLSNHQESQQKQIYQLNEQLKLCNKIKSRMDKDIKDKDQQINNQKQKIEQMKTGLQGKIEELNSFKKQIEDSTQQLEMKKIIIKTLEIQKIEDQQIIDNLKSKINDFDQQNSAKIDQTVNIQQTYFKLAQLQYDHMNPQKKVILSRNQTKFLQIRCILQYAVYPKVKYQNECILNIKRDDFFIIHNRNIHCYLLNY